MQTGRVKWWNAEKGFGFILQDGGPDVFVHFSSLETAPDAEGKRNLREGEEVEYEARKEQKGLQASRVRRVQDLEF